jgi:hypothetical protein
MMYNVCDNESACNEVYQNNDKPQGKTSKSIIYRQYRHIRLAFICMTYTMINSSG